MLSDVNIYEMLSDSSDDATRHWASNLMLAFLHSD